ncbi:hypothetical protein DAPPUDRAFT_104614 [Daphnia pulex]|uniref:Uncharacterized protein n=1 Tax=Daphnia pulex TaxID=6669 RepID=E9GMS3_DAPPU|nr:hypothetical protein DAPPUDRAFT_104614 [Daphnia pulex]|eukprot:EFX79240.1 hypothetical protein DAPPUDRAFT_104614 [Daphnia pulex]
MHLDITAFHPNGIVNSFHVFDRYSGRLMSIFRLKPAILALELDDKSVQEVHPVESPTVERRRRRLDQVRYYFICGFVLFNWKCQAPLATTKGALVLSSSKPPAELVAIVFNHSTAKKVNKLGLMEI